MYPYDDIQGKLKTAEVSGRAGYLELVLDLTPFLVTGGT